MIRLLAIISILLLTITPAWADSAVPCVRMLGDFWGETPAPSDIRTLDGTAYKSPEDLARAVGDGAVIQGGNFSEWDFRKVRLTKACFVEADLKGSVWTGASAPGVGFIKSDLTEAALSSIRAPGVLFRDAVLTNTHADKADFSGGWFEGGWFDGGVDGWKLDEANLTGFTFSCGITLSDGCPLYDGDRQISARGADFTRAKLSSFHRYGLSDIELDGAVLDRTEISPGQLASMKGRKIVHPLVLTGADRTIELSVEEAQAIADDTAIAASFASGPSFDCARAASAVEKMLCLPDAPDLGQADRDMAALFARVRKVRPQAVAEQRQWIGQRDACMRGEYPSDCVRAAHRDRIGVLLGQLGEQEWLARGQGAVFIEDSLPLTDAMRASAVFARIAPVLAGASDALVYVSRAADGSYAVSGEAVGANAHTCSLGASGLRLDPLTGWYSAPIPGKRLNARVIRVHDDVVEVFESGRPSGDLPEAELDYASCGMRAAFSPLRRIDLQPADLKRYADQARLHE
ncbi:pentapeptide repeats family protein [Blastomonas sp. RAC04]|uniref:pentapeptide repeat-containing protein n=1 Tax=Blastomonas sp. RAC04 TaxID=1842535 RepID=UPI000856D650|nr:pentapeptide repeat-containing protein [Blastomonas sp. RAC04]AOF99224.1 pentapeptide repeats family protein [Blastomonas sp. RAC04]